MHIFIDDLRTAPEKYDAVFRTGEQFLQWLEQHPTELIHSISFDHDLGLNVIDGYETVKRMVDLQNHIQKVQFHTDNPIGMKNMYMYILNAHKHGLMPNLKKIIPYKIKCINGKESPMKSMRIGDI